MPTTPSITEDLPSLNNCYLETILLLQKLNWDFLEVVRMHLVSLGIRDITNSQALAVLAIGDEEIPVGRLKRPGSYIDGNVDHNIMKMVRNGYVIKERSKHDKRSFRIRLTERGRALCEKLNVMHRRHIEMLAQTAVTDEDLQEVIKELNHLESFWVRVGDLAQQQRQFATD